MKSTLQHKYDEKRRCVGCGLTEEQVEDRGIRICNGKLSKNTIGNKGQKIKKYF